MHGAWGKQCFADPRTHSYLMLLAPCPMPIQVTCPGCLTRFSVSEKFAGQKGPCPKCKEVISIPKPSEEVVIHAPKHSEAGAVGVSGRHVLKTYRRQDAKFQPLVFVAVAAAVLVTLLAAIVMRFLSDEQLKSLLLVMGAVLLGPPSAWAGYSFLRDAELEGYQGKALLVRAAICGMVYALLWGVYWYVGRLWGGPDAFTKGLEIYQLVVLAGLPLALGTLAAFVSFDLEIVNAFFHCAMYFAVTVVLRLVAGLPALPGLVFDS